MKNKFFSATFSKEGVTFLYDVSKDGDGWTIARIGKPLEERCCECEHDCCGHTFTQWEEKRFFGLVHIMRYGINV